MELPPAQECIVRGTLAFVLRLSKIVGIASLKFEKFGKGWHIRTSKAASIYGITLIGIMSVILLTTKSLQFFYFLEMSAQNFSMILSFGVIALVVALLWAEIYFKQYRMKHMITCLSHVEKVNVELSQYTVYKSNEKIQRFVAISTLIGALTTMPLDPSIRLIEMLAQPNSGITHSLQVTLHFVFVIVKVLNLQISLIITTVLSSYTHLNECLKKLLQQMWKESLEPKASLPKSRFNANISPKSINILIDTMGSIEDRAATKYEDTNDVILSRLGFLYCILHDVVQQLDNSHGLFLVLLITSHFINIANTLYNFLKYMMRMEDYYQVLVWFLRTTCFIYDMVIIIEPSHQTCQQVKHTKHLISQLMLLTPLESHAFNSELNLFYKNLLFNEVSYSPMKMFKLNRTIITVVTGSITTYLVVMLKL